MMASNSFDHDWLVVGSGFGGSVSALRLTEKGYRVAVLECGRRYRDEDLARDDLEPAPLPVGAGARSARDLRLSVFKDVFIASGSAVGGGSVVYACTLYRAAPAFYANPQWAALDDWAAALKPHYDTAERMLGVNTVPFASDGQQLLKEMATHFGVAHTASIARPSASTSASPARPCPTLTSAAPGQRERVASDAARAWWVAASARRTRC